MLNIIGLRLWVMTKYIYLSYLVLHGGRQLLKHWLKTQIKVDLWPEDNQLWCFLLTTLNPLMTSVIPE